MIQILKKAGLMLVVAVFVFQAFAVNFVSAAEVSKVEWVEFNKQTEYVPLSTSNDENVEARLAPAAVFFGGMVVAWATSAGISYVTGYSPEYWIEKGIGQVHNSLISTYKYLTTQNLHANIYVSNYGSVSYRCSSPTENCPIPNMVEE